MARKSSNNVNQNNNTTVEETVTEETTEMSELPDFLAGNNSAPTAAPDFSAGVPSFLSGGAAENPFSGGMQGGGDVNFDDEYEGFDSSHLTGDVVDPFAPIPPDFYRFRISAAKPRKNQETGKIDVEVTFSVAEGQYASRSLKVWLQLPSKNDGRTAEQKQQARNFTRFYLTKFGLDDAQIMAFTPTGAPRMLIGNEFYGQVINKPMTDRDRRAIPGKFVAEVAKFYSMEEYNKAAANQGGSANAKF